MADALYDWPELYDLVAAPDAAMEQFYVSMVGGKGRRVLELACGTGRLTVPIAKSGASVTGGDLSERMLAQAHRRATTAGVDIELVQLDMRSFDLGRRFEAIIVPANSLLHLTKVEDLLDFLSAVARHLDAGGYLVFDIFVPSARLLSLPRNSRQTLGDFDHPELGVVTLEETIEYDPITQVSRADWYWSRAGHPDFRRMQIDMRQIYPQELPLLLELGGFGINERFGEFGRGPLRPASMRQVVVATRV